MKYDQLTKRELAKLEWIISIVMLVFFFLALYWPKALPAEYPSDITINPTIINGLITVAGILFGFVVAAAVATKAPKVIYVMFVFIIGYFFTFSSDYYTSLLTENRDLLLLSAGTAMTILWASYAMAGTILVFKAFERFLGIVFEKE